MQRKINLTTGIPLLCFVILLFTSCNGDKDKKGTEVTIPDTTSLKPVTNALTAGSLDTLYIERSALDTMNNGSKLVFSFTFKAADSLTLHGWLLKQNKFDDLPNIKLKNGKASGLSYGIGTYFGNIVLSPSEFNKIKTVLTPGKNFVLFAPYFLSTNNIAYRVFVSDNDPGPTFQVMTVTPTGAIANPSPPKVD